MRWHLDFSAGLGNPYKSSKPAHNKISLFTFAPRTSVRLLFAVMIAPDFTGWTSYKMGALKALESDGKQVDFGGNSLKREKS